MTEEAVKTIKKLERISGSYIWRTKRAFWILCYCYFVNGKNEVIRWKQLEEAELMGTETLAGYLRILRTDGYLVKVKNRSGAFYKLSDKAKKLMEQELGEAVLLLQLRDSQKHS